MSAAALVAYIALVLVLLAALPTAWVLLREGWSRLVARRALDRLELARKVLERGAGENPEEVARRLREGFDAGTVERVMLLLLHEADVAKKQWAVSTFERLGLMERYVSRVREASTWSERAHAAEVLGLVGVASAVPALVAALRDPHEDVDSVKAAAATALARIHAEEAIPLLVEELRTTDAGSSPRVAEALTRFGALAVAPLVELLRDEEHPQAAVWAARILGRIGDKAATAALLERLFDRSDTVRMAATEALGSLGDRRATQALLRAALSDPMPQVRAHAAGAIGRMGAEASIDVLVAALADPDYGTRVRALEALEMIQPTDTGPLERSLRDENADVRKRAALALDRVGYLSARVAELGSEDPPVARRASTAVLELGLAGLADAIAAHLHHADFRVRARVARICGELGVPRLAALLAASAEDPSWPVRARVAEALGALRAEEGTAALVALLGDAEPVVRDTAAEALAQREAKGMERFFPELSRAYHRGSVAARLAVLKPVASFEGAEALGLLQKALSDPNSAVRLSALELIASRNSAVAVESLVARLEDPERSVRLAAIDTLGRRGRRGRKDSVDALLGALSGASLEAKERITDALAFGGGDGKDDGKGDVLRERLDEFAASPDLELRICLCWTLGKQGDPAVLPYLKRALRDPDARLRSSAAGAIGKIPGAASVHALLLAVNDRDPHTRAAAVNGLGKIGPQDDRVFEVLEGRLADPDAFVRNRAAIALGRVGGPRAERTLAECASGDRVEAAARVVAAALLGTESALSSVTDLLSNEAEVKALGEFLRREDVALRREVLARLCLDDLGGAAEAPVDQAAVVERYQRILRTGQGPSSRRLAVEVLAKVQGDRSVEALADTLAIDPVEGLRVLAAHALAARRSLESAREALARGVADPCAEVAIVAAKALGEAGDRRFSDALFRRLALGPAAVQSAVEEALARLHRGATEAFVQRMAGPSRPEATAACLRVLERIAEPSLVPLLKGLLASKEPAVRGGVVRVLVRIPTPEALTLLEEASMDPSEAVRVEVLPAVTSEGGAASAVIARFRLDPSPTVRRHLAERLATLPAGQARELSDALLEDPALEVRAAAMVSLLARAEPDGLKRFVASWASMPPDVQRAARSDRRGAAAVEQLAPLLLSSREARARELTVEALAAYAVGDLDRLLLPALRDPASEVRTAAARALSLSESAATREAVAALADDPDPTVRAAAQGSRLRVVR